MLIWVVFDILGKLLTEHETHKLKSLDEEYQKELKEWKSNLVPRKKVRVKRLQILLTFFFRTLKFVKLSGFVVYLGTTQFYAMKFGLWLHQACCYGEPSVNMNAALLLLESV